MYQSKTVAAILLAGGSGTRFGSDGNKVYVELLGRPMLSYSLEILAAHPWVDELILVAKAGEEAVFRGLMEKVGAAKPYRVVCGGSTRQESVCRGLAATEAELVVIHDGARPLLRSSYIGRCLEAVATCPGVSIAVRAKDTIKLTDASGRVQQTTVRANTWQVQTPQCFVRETLWAAHQRFGGEQLTDDCMALELAGEAVQLLEGDYTNIKVTTPEDLALAERLMVQMRESEGEI